ncbi:response regulator [Klenkia brasiliensis]|uniref:Response regulator receiver domain-containing protein n=1 Tax=Klenkia brasiliensis TaxID=333142 RepID=A0A1G7T7L2_9ACTN|nr:response regulator transcription factor [Klenkia brasiliensis]SDG31248.1 Response regulator receiver domain-containing protein [Klenkia brasiliensis]
MISVLVADDHAFVRRSVVDVLTGAGDIEVVTQCEDGDEVLAAVQLHRPDVALLDVRMQRMSGIAAAREVSTRTATRVLMLSGSLSDQLLADAADAGAAGFALKGDDPAHLPELVRRVAQGGTAWGRRHPALPRVPEV